MGRFVQGMDRRQAAMLPECLEDWVDENNPVRAVDAGARVQDRFWLAAGGGVMGLAGVAAAARPQWTCAWSYRNFQLQSMTAFL
jgi:hypothetical protein